MNLDCRDRRGLRRGLPRGTRRAEARQRPSLRAPATDGGRRFRASAEASAAHRRGAGARVGARVLAAPSARRWRRSGQNTNLGIVLLCAPLAAAAETAGGDLRAALSAASSPASTGEDAARRLRRDRRRKSGRPRPRRRTRCPRAADDLAARGDGRRRPIATESRDNTSRAYEDVFVLGLGRPGRGAEAGGDRAVVDAGGLSCLSRRVPGHARRRGNSTWRRRRACGARRRSGATGSSADGRSGGR